MSLSTSFKAGNYTSHNHKYVWSGKQAGFSHNWSGKTIKEAVHDYTAIEVLCFSIRIVHFLRPQSCQGRVFISINFTTAPLVSVSSMFIMSIIYLLHSVVWLPRSLLIPAAGAMTQHVPQAGKLELENSRGNKSPLISSLHLGKSVSDHPGIQVTCMNLSKFKQNQLPYLCFQKKILVDGLVCVDVHEGSVSHKLIASKAVVIGFKNS